MFDNELNHVSEDVFLKIEKLLALGASQNEHEAALAMAKATELLQKYNLDISIVRDRPSDNEIQEAGSKPLATPMGGKARFSAKADFVVVIVQALAHANMCRALYSRHQIYFVGKTATCKVVAYIFDALYLQLIMLHRQAVKDYLRRLKAENGHLPKSIYTDKVSGQVWGRSWLRGAADTIALRLQEQTERFKKASSETMTGQELMVITDQAVEIYLKDKYPLPKKNFQSYTGQQYDREAYLQGRMQGHDIQFHKVLEDAK